MILSAASMQDFAECYTAGWCSQNASSVGSFFSPEGSLTVNHGVPSVGRAAITESAQGFMIAFPDLRLAMDKLGIHPDRVEYHWTFTGTNIGPGGIGNPVKITGVESWKIGEDGLVAESIGQFDGDDYQRQLRDGPAGRMR